MFSTIIDIIITNLHPYTYLKEDRTVQDTKNFLVPTVIDQINHKERVYDIYSRLLESRIVMLHGEIEDTLASCIVAQLLFLEQADPHSDIDMYIMSPGGSVSSAFAIYDIMTNLKCDVATLCIGSAASAAAFLLGAGKKGKRRALPHAKIMIHQPWTGGLSGKVTDVAIAFEELKETKLTLNKIWAEQTGQALEKVTADMEHDYWMTAEAAKVYGVIDEVITREKRK